MLEFDEDDDDFGDLYTDLKVKASRTLTKLLPEEGENLDSIEAKDSEEGRDGNESGNGEESDSESEDGLNIVLNDDEEGNFFNNNCEVNAEKLGFDNEVGYGVEDVDGMENDGGGGRGGYSAQSKLMRSHSQSAVFSNNVKGNVSTGAASYSSTLVGGNREDKSCGPGFSSGLKGTQCWCNISLPRYRTILDVNIDALEWKPWRYPGADMTDFFNFGLDEDSWKCYCDHLDKYRGKRTEVNGCAAYKPSRHTKPKGKAIQVKEGIGERQPPVTVRHPVERDLNVIIQIPVQDIEEDLPNSPKGAIDGTSSFVQEASDAKESRDIAANDGGDVLCFSSASEDGPPSLEVSSEGTHKSSPERCFKHISACDCDPAHMESDYFGSHQVSEADELHQPETSEGSSDGSFETTRSSDDLKKGVSNVKPLAAACRKDLESSDAQLSLYSPSSSPSQSHDLASRYGDRFQGHSKRASPNSVSEVWESVISDYHSPKDSGSHGIKMKPGDPEYFTRSRSPIQSNNKFQQKKSRMAELKSYRDNQDALCISDSEKFHDLPHPTIGRSIRRNRHRGFDYSEREDFLKDEESELSFYCGGEKLCDYQSSDAYAGNSHWRTPLDSGYERDLPHRRIMDGKRCFPGERTQRSDDDVFESRLSVEEMDSLHYDGPRQFIAEQLPFPDSRNHTQRKRKLEELHFKRRRKNNKFMLECIYSNEYTQENYRCSRNDTRERDVIEHQYDRLLSYPRREVESPVRSKRKFDNHLKVYETIRHRDCEDKKVRYIGNSFSSLSYKKYRITGRGRGRGDVFRRQGSFERYSGSKFGGWADGFHNEENVENPDDQDNFGRRRLYLESEVLQWGEDKYSSWHADGDFQVERTLIPFKRISRSQRSDAKHYNGGNLIGYEFQQNRCKQSRKGINGSQFLQNSNFTHKDVIGRTVPRSWNSTDKHMVVGNRKSSRCFKGGSLSNVRYEYLDWNDHSGQRIFEDSDESQLENRVQANNDRRNTFKDATRFHKFPDAKRNDSPDVEEGQISTKDFDEEPKEKSCASKDTTGITGSENLSGKNPKILEMMAKMEKRQERFKQPLVNVSEKNGKPSVDKFAQTADIKKLQRPTRKRKWIAS